MSRIVTGVTVANFMLLSYYGNLSSVNVIMLYNPNNQGFPMEIFSLFENIMKILKQILIYIVCSDVEAEAEAPEAVVFWWKRKQKHLKICRFHFHSVSKLLFEFW
jgi:beta-xylosidase